MPLPMPVLPGPAVPPVLPDLLASRRSSRRHFSFSSVLAILSHLPVLLLAALALPPTVLPVPTLEPDDEVPLPDVPELPDAPGVLEGLVLLPEALLPPDMPLLPEVPGALLPPEVPEALLSWSCLRQVSLSWPVRPSQRALDVLVGEPVLTAGGVVVVPEPAADVPELLGVPELCANAALARSAAAVAVPSNFNIVELLPRGGGRRTADFDTQASCRPRVSAPQDL